jgi:hypothetical protein
MFVFPVEERTPVMKIQQPLQGVANSPSPSVQRPVQTNGAPDFRSLLEDSLQRAAAPPPSEAPQASRAVGPAPAVPEIGTAPTQVVDRIDRFLDLLDTYRWRLADPDTSLRQIELCIQNIEKQKAHLTPVLEALPADDRLHDILNETLVTASAEVARFRRGDYLDD